DPEPGLLDVPVPRADRPDDLDLVTAIRELQMRVDFRPHVPSLPIRSPTGGRFLAVRVSDETPPAAIGSTEIAAIVSNAGEACEQVARFPRADDVALGLVE